MKAFFWAWMFFSTNLFAQLQEEPVELVYKVTEVKGSVLVLPAHAGKWRKINAGVLLPENLLVQVQPGGKLAIELPRQSRVLSLGGASQKIVIESPSVFRLSTDLFRRVSTKEKFLDSLPEELAKEDLKAESDSYFDEAWQRVVAIFRGNEMSREQRVKIEGDRAKEKIGIDIKYRPIALFLPSQGAVIEQRDLPLKVQAVWSEVPAEQNPTYVVRVWADGEDPMARAVTKQTQYLLSLPKPGKYYVMITTVDKKYASTPHLVVANVLEPGSAGQRPLADTVKLKTPMDNTVFLSTTKFKSVDFSWQVVGRQPEESFCFFYLSGPSGSKVSNVFQKGFLRKKLRAGTYNWYVECLNEIGEKHLSKQRTLEIKKGPANFDQSIELFSESVANPQKHVVINWESPGQN